MSCAGEQPDATILEEPSVWGVQELGNDAVVIRLVAKTDPSEQWGVGRILRARIKKAFDEAGIEIPFPQRTVWIRNESDTDGAEPRRLPDSVDGHKRPVASGDDEAPAELSGHSGSHDGGDGGDE